MLRLIKRHLAACKKTKETDLKGCDCPFTAIGPHPMKRGERFKQPLDTADYGIASDKLRKIEIGFHLEPDQAEPWTLAKATTEFRNTKADKSKERRNKFRRILHRQILFLAVRYKIIDPEKASEIEKLDARSEEEKAARDKKIEDIGRKILIKKNPPKPDKPDLDAFLCTFTGTIGTNTGDRSLLMEFWLWCFDSEITAKNIGAKVKKFGGARERKEHNKKRKPTFTNEEKDAVFEQLAPENISKTLWKENAQDPEASIKTRVFQFVQVFTGFAISDVVTLRFNELKINPDDPTQVLIEHFRIKTGTTAYPSIPLWLADQLWTSFTPESAEYPFWSGQGDPESCAKTYRDRMKKIFIAAGVRVYERMKKKKSGGITKPVPELVKDSHADPHFWRHTFVRDCYLELVPVSQIARMLGDDEAAIMKYYSCFDDLRDKAVMESLRKLHNNRMPSQSGPASFGLHGPRRIA